jgi:2-oxoglutarate dehydrogenase E2 component (dihydrolipoamide succinyltransferase)
MIEDFLLPELGSGVTEATIVMWHKQVGDRIAANEILLEVMTEKVNTEVECNTSGTIVEILCPKDTVVKVGDVIAKIKAC